MGSLLFGWPASVASASFPRINSDQKKFFQIF